VNFSTMTHDEAVALTDEQLINKRTEGQLPPIGGGALESNINSIWVSKQTGRGVPAVMTVGTKRGRWVGGDLNVARADGTEQFSDGTLFGDTVDFVNTLTGAGAPVVQGQAGLMAYLNWLSCGQESVTGGINAVHTLTSTATGGTFSWTMNGYTVSGLNPTTTTGPTLAAALLTAVNSQGSSFPAGSITGTGAAGGPWVITFVNPGSAQGLGFQPVPLPTINNSLATGGTVTAVSTTTGMGFTHVATPSDVGGFWTTWAKSVGKSVVWRGQFNDCRISSLRWEGSSASKVVKLTPTLMILDPGQIIAADPTQVDDGTRPFIYTDAAGTFNIDGQIYRGHSSFAMEAQWGLAEWYGDSVTPYDVTNTRATVQLSGITILIDAQGLARYNEQIYGTPTPAVGARPLTTIPALGSYSCTFSRTSPYTGLAVESAVFTLPSVKWDPSLNIPANPAGGPVELAMAAEYRKTAGQPAFTVAVTTPFSTAFSS
jgi:hypothetical protein